MIIPILTDEFYPYIEKEIKAMYARGDEPVPIVGNPYTDNAILIVAALHRRYFGSDVHPAELRYKDLLDVFSYGSSPKMRFGREIAWINRAAKVSYMLFPNNPLLHQAYTKKKSNDPLTMPQDNGPSKLAERMYVFTLFSFLKTMHEGEGDLQCTYCGSNAIFDFDSYDVAVRSTLFEKYKPKNFPTGFTRSWYPLVGTISEAQAYHGYGQQPLICSTCLMLVHFLPSGSRLFKGKVLLFQTNDIDISFEFAKGNVEEALGKYILTGGERFESPGKGENKAALYVRLLDIFRDVAIAKGVDLMEFKSALMLWMFSNSGQGADAEIEQLPNQVLRNLHQFDRLWGKELRRFLRMDEKSRTTFVDALKRGSEYYGFYPATSEELPTEQFFEVYQTRVIGRPQEIMAFYKTVSHRVTEDNTRKAIDNALKEQRSGTLSQMIHKAIFSLVNGNNLPWETLIYWIVKEIPRSGYRPFNYYLHPKAELEVEEVPAIQADTKVARLVELAASSYLLRARARGGFSKNSLLAALQSERETRVLRELELLAMKIPGAGWAKYLDWQAQLRRVRSSLRQLMFSTAVISKFMREDFSEPDVDILEIKEYPTVVDLEIDSLLNEGVLELIYGYLRERTQTDGFSPERALNDLRRLVEESKRSLESFIHFHSLKGIFVEEEDFIESQQNAETYIGDERPGFSWPAMRRQLVNFLCQLEMVDNWKYQLEEELMVKENEDTI